jgi:hypothetical protein
MYLLKKKKKKGGGAFIEVVFNPEMWGLQNFMILWTVKGIWIGTENNQYGMDESFKIEHFI